MHTKARCKISIYSVILGQLEPFRNYKGFEYDFPENFRCNLTFNERDNFSDSSLHDIFESEKLRFRFSAKIALPGQ